MESYIGAKIIKAKPMSRKSFQKEQEGTHDDRPDKPGYKVVYPGGYTSWSPAGVFEQCYRQISIQEKSLINE